MKKTTITFSLFIIFASILASGCTPSSEPVADEGTNEIILATTTSTQDSGLLDFLLPKFHADSQYLVKTIAVGTGQALKMAEEGNADVLLVHAPASEVELVEKGYGVDRTLIMHNDFVIIGPADDPAGISGMELATDALQHILNSGSTFVSRGDDSGTHKMELALWSEIEQQPQGDAYVESGQGMAATLRIASEKGGYTLTDRATYLANQEDLDLEILVEGDQRLLNIYHVISVNPEKWPQANYAGAQAFSAFLVSQEIQKMIGEFGVEQYGQPLFFPDAGKTASDFGLD